MSGTPNLPTLRLADGDPAAFAPSLFGLGNRLGFSLVPAAIVAPPVVRARPHVEDEPFGSGRVGEVFMGHCRALRCMADASRDRGGA